MNDVPAILHAVEHGVVVPPENGAEAHEALTVKIAADDYDPSDPLSALGIDWDGRSRSALRAGYFCGTVWISPGHSALCVSPKISRIDTAAMLERCLESRSPGMADALARIILIDPDAPPVPVECTDRTLSLFVVTRFLSLIPAVGSALKHSYADRTETFKGKIKGRLLSGPTLTRCFAAAAIDRTVCSRSEYLPDCIENRILKAALRECRSYLLSYPSMPWRERLLASVATGMRFFRDVADIPASRLLHNCATSRSNAFYAVYRPLLSLARVIMRQNAAYAVSTSHGTCALHGVIPHALNMPLLFELYTRALLHEAYGRKISYHLSTYGNETDFVKHDEKLIVDTKYIHAWKHRINHDNVRQLAGYARSRSLRGKIARGLLPDNEMLECLIVYPDREGISSFDPSRPLAQQAVTVPEYVKFRKLGLRLPLIAD